MTPLAHTRLVAPGANASRDFYFLHGVLGSRSNWRSVARRLVAGRPDIGAVLVDLREHGDSGARPGPSTLASCTADLDGLAEHLGRPVAGVLGHSFGGKVALRWSQDRGASFDEVWVVDSTPGARPDRHGSERLLEVLAALRVMPRSWPTRGDLVRRLVSMGFSESLAQWLAMNLRPEVDGGLVFSVDLDAIEALLDDYFAQDLWPAVEGSEVGALHLVVGGRSNVFDIDDRARARAIAARRPNVHTHILPDAGHFVHVDAPDDLLRLMRVG
ncbi:MAG: alpha/beta hydrolase [Deltaproteobacteria bacterium]|nr:alpha/beta hydrolase [Deltaproteobacteria bacterium]